MGLEFFGMDTLPSGAGVKAVVISPDKENVYSANLEGMSVVEYDRLQREITRKLSFIPTPGQGYNYSTEEYFDSYEEKPVELAFTHSGRYLWISLHNAGGIVVWDLVGGDTYIEGVPMKRAILRSYLPSGISKSEVKLLFIETGKTPKVMASSPDGKYLFVSNWHSDTVSVLDVSSEYPEMWEVVREISARIPRGLLITPDSKTLYIAEMGAEHIMEIDLESFKKVRSMRVGLNPRHMLLHNGKLFISINLSDQIASLDLASGELIKSPTCIRPRTISMDTQAGVIYSVCYREDRLQAFTMDTLELIGQWDSPPHPVGLDLFTNGQGTMEAWVANYTTGVITVYDLQVAEKDDDHELENSSNDQSAKDESDASQLK